MTHWEEMFEVWAEQEVLRPQPGLAPREGLDYAEGWNHREPLGGEAPWGQSPGPRVTAPQASLCPLQRSLWPGLSLDRALAARKVSGSERYGRMGDVLGDSYSGFTQRFSCLPWGRS